MLQADAGSLPRAERAALARIIRAARRMDVLYVQQVWPGTAPLLAENKDLAQPVLDAVRFFKGPWLPDGAPFIAGVPEARPPMDFYPADASKAELEKWLTSLRDRDRARAMAPFTTIRRAVSGGFEIVPYSRHYRSGLEPAAKDLAAAAGLTREPTLRRFLRARAAALLDDDYYASDVAFVNLKGPIDVVLGPYEVDDDGWFGVKTSFEAQIALVNQAATKRIADVASHLQELEDHLPLAPALRGRKLADAAPVLILDAIYFGGMSDAGSVVAGYGLPNDVRVLQSVGARTGTYRNVLESRYESEFRPIAEAAVASPEREALRFEDILDEILFVRMFDSVGPQLVEGSRRPILEALAEDGSVAGQIRSMLLSLWGHRYLIEHGMLEARQRDSLYAAFLVPALARLRGAGSPGPAARGSTYVLNHLVEAHAIQADADGRLAIDPARADEDVVRAAGEFVSVMARGDAAAVKALLQRHGAVRPEVKAVLERLGAAPPRRRPIFPTADQLDPG